MSLSLSVFTFRFVIFLFPVYRLFDKKYFFWKFIKKNNKFKILLLIVQSMKIYIYKNYIENIFLKK